ncbi:MAG: replication-associated recombination protein A, partial [Candidatus Puniceispirillaceae bacterium]
FRPISAVFDGVAELRRIFAEARPAFEAGLTTLLFVDEIHRFNKAQQDALLPAIEEGMIRLIGATTENPSFSLNSALLSRVQVLVLNALDDQALTQLIARAQAHLGRPLPLDEGARLALVHMADGDGRYLINLMETLTELSDADTPPMDAASLSQLLARRAQNYDRAGDEHYNLISALHKSLRASDCDAGLYWLARMMLAGEDLHFILRRLTRFASEDIGLAAPEAVGKAISAWQSYERLGSPEGDLAIAELVIFLATAPKSNAAYKAWKQAQKTARDAGHLMPPKHILNSPTQLMKELDYGKGYAYDHDSEDGFSGQNCFPDALERTAFYQPVERGFEREIKKRLAYWDRLRAGRKPPVDDM